MSITAKTRISFCKETSWGNPGTKWNLLPANPPTTTTTYENILDQGLRGVPAKDFAAYQGAGTSEVTLEGVFYPEELGYFLFGIMGSASVTGTTPPYTHTFLLAKECPSFTVEDYPYLQEPGKAPENIAYQYRGLLISSLVIRFNAGEGAVGFTATMAGKPSVTTTPSVVTGEPNPPLLGWQATVEVGGSVYRRLVDTEITFAREVVMQHAANNTQEPSFGYSGPLEVTGRSTIEFHTDDDYKKYRNHVLEPIRFVLERGSGANLKRLEIFLPIVSYLESPMEIDRGAVNVKLNVSFRALYSPSIGSPAQLVLKNSQSSYNI